MKKLILLVLLLSTGISSAAVVESGWTRTNNAAAARTALGVPGLTNNNVFASGTSNNIPILNVGTISATNSYTLDNVKHPRWGAKGDDVTDDYASISNAAVGNAGGTITFPPGRYRHSATLTFSNLNVIGDPGATFLIPDNTITASAVIVQNSLDSLTGIGIPKKIYGLEIVGTNTTSKTGIYFGPPGMPSTCSVTLEKVSTIKFQGGTGKGLVVDQLVNCSINDSVFTKSDINLATGSDTNLPTTVAFTSCDFRLSEVGSGVLIQSSHGMTFSHCIFEANKAEGMVIIPATDCDAVGVVVDENCWFEQNFYNSSTAVQTNNYSIVLDGNGRTAALVVKDSFFNISSTSVKMLRLTNGAIATLDNPTVGAGSTGQIQLDGANNLLYIVNWPDYQGLLENRLVNPSSSVVLNLNDFRYYLDNIHVDHSTGKIGFGITNPATLFHVYGADQEVRLESSGNTPRLGFYSASSNPGNRNWLWIANNSVIGALELYRSTTAGSGPGTPVMGFNGTNGYAGFGTSLPLTALHISASDPALRVYSTDTAPSIELMQGQPTGDYRNWRMVINNSAQGSLDIARSTSASGAPTTPVMSFDLNGNIGIPGTLTANDLVLQTPSSTTAISMLGLDGSGNVVSNAVPGGSGTVTSVSMGTNFSVANPTTTPVGTLTNLSGTGAILMQTNPAASGMTLNGFTTNKNIAADSIAMVDANQVETNVIIGANLTLSGGVLSASGSGGATVALDNLSAVAINSALLPATNNVLALGSTTKQWASLFLAEAGVINWDNGDATLTQNGNTVTLAGANFTAPNFTATASVFSVAHTNTGNIETLTLNSGDAVIGYNKDIQVGGRLFTSVSSFIITNTTTESNLWTSINGTATLKSNYLSGSYGNGGFVMRITAAGRYSSAAAAQGTITFTVLLGATTVLTTGNITLPTSVTDKPWRLNCTLSCRATGTSGKVIGNGDVVLQDGTLDTGHFLPLSGGTTDSDDAITVNSTIDHAISVKAKFSATTAPNQITGQQVFCEILR